jgi:hypothetical protein
VIGVEVDCDLGLIAAKPKAYVASSSNRLLHCGFMIVFTFTFSMLFRVLFCLWGLCCCLSAFGGHAID